MTISPTQERLVLLEKLAKIPDSAREFTISETAARREFEVPADVLHVLRSDGLPAEQSAGQWFFDWTDLLNVALHLDIGSRHRKVLAWWARELQRPYGDSVTYRLDYDIGCPNPGHNGNCHYRLLVPGGEQIDVTRDTPEVSVLTSVNFTLNRRWPTLPAELVMLINELTDVQFVRLPPTLCWDTDFIQATGIGDCCGTSKLMVDEGNRRGMPARLSYGRSLTPPFSSIHYWAEFLVDDAWVPIDPILIDTLLQWGLLSPATWTRCDSLGGIMGRLAGEYHPLVLHNDEDLSSSTSLSTYRIG